MSGAVVVVVLFAVHKKKPPISLLVITRECRWDQSL